MKTIFPNQKHCPTPDLDRNSLYRFLRPKSEAFPTLSTAGSKRNGHIPSGCARQKTVRRHPSRLSHPPVCVHHNGDYNVRNGRAKDPNNLSHTPYVYKTAHRNGPSPLASRTLVRVSTKERIRLCETLIRKQKAEAVRWFPCPSLQPIAVHKASASLHADRCMPTGFLSECQIEKETFPIVP